MLVQVNPLLDLHVDQEEQKGMTLETAAKMFHTMAEQDGLEFTYKVLNTRLLRENLSIPPSLWNELEPSIREKINEIRNKLKNNQPNYHPRPPAKSPNPEIPHQYPS